MRMQENAIIEQIATLIYAWLRRVVLKTGSLHLIPRNKLKCPLRSINLYVLDHLLKRGNCDGGLLRQLAIKP